MPSMTRIVGRCTMIGGSLSASCASIRACSGFSPERRGEPAITRQAIGTVANGRSPASANSSSPVSSSRSMREHLALRPAGRRRYGTLSYPGQTTLASVAMRGHVARLGDIGFPPRSPDAQPRPDAKPRPDAGNVTVYRDISGIPDVGFAEDRSLSEGKRSAPYCFFPAGCFLPRGSGAVGGAATVASRWASG